MKDFFHLQDVVDVEIMQEIQDKFADATGMAAVIVDYQGKPVTRYSNFTHFCQCIRSSKKGKDNCEHSDAHGGLEAARTGKPCIYRCHTGLVDLAAPIIVRGQYLGSILSGQVLLEESELDTLDHIATRVDLEQTPELKEAYEKIQVVHKNKIEAAAQLMYLMANYIVEKGIANLVQKQLNEKNIRLMEEIKARAELEKALKNSELHALQSQINPHFLFNTLNTISRLALLEKAEKTQEVVYSLSELLRYSLRKIDQIVTLEEELNHIQRYLTIQETRFSDRMETEFKINPDIYQARVPLLTLQPLIENAIVHGLEPKPGPGRIIVEGYLEDSNVILLVKDTGVGIPEEMLRRLARMEEQLTSGSGHTTGLGLNNVHRRIQHYFGTDYGLRITSKPAQGTTVAISFPYVVA